MDYPIAFRSIRECKNLVLYFHVQVFADDCLGEKFVAELYETSEEGVPTNTDPLFLCSGEGYSQ